LGSEEGVDKLFFELASESRLDILRELQSKELRMQDLARKLNLTVTETCRQLQRLTEAKLVQKQPNGTNTLTRYAKLQIQLMASMDFVFRNADYFLDHALFSLPYEFVNRIGELSDAEFCRDTVSGFNRVRKMVFEAEKYIWTIAEQVDSSHVGPTGQKVSKGLDFKFLMQKDLVKTFANASNSSVLRGRSRYMERVPVVLVINENEATVVFRRYNGVLDYMGLFGTDERFRKWCKDLFLYYWETAEKWFPDIQII
jgi:predicted transcriptional regulator